MRIVSFLFITEGLLTSYKDLGRAELLLFRGMAR